MSAPAAVATRRWLFRALLVVSVVGALAAYGGPLLFQLRGERLLVLTSGSMTGTYDAGTAVVVQPITGNQLAAGQIVTFREGDTWVTHRIVKFLKRPESNPDGTLLRGPDGNLVQDYYVQTKGDANADPDPNLVPVGQVRYQVVGGYAHLGTFLLWSRLMVGRIVLFAPPFLLLLAAEMWSWRRPRGNVGDGADEPAAPLDEVTDEDLAQAAESHDATPALA